MPKDFKDIPRDQNGDFSIDKLSELRGDTFEIESIRFGEADIGNYAVVTIEGKDYRTFSKVLLKQLKDIEKFMNEEQDRVVVSLKRVGDYYTFA